MQKPSKPRRPASKNAKITAFGITAVLLAITGYMLVTGPSSDFTQSGGTAPLEAVDDALQGVADGMQGQ